MNFANRARYLGGCNAVTDSPTSNRISFRHRVDDHGALTHPVNLCHRDMLYLCALARIENMFVDLVREAERVKFLAKSGDKFHLFTTEDFPGGVVWITNDNRFGVGVEG